MPLSKNLKNLAIELGKNNSVALKKFLKRHDPNINVEGQNYILNDDQFSDVILNFVNKPNSKISSGYFTSDMVYMRHLEFRTKIGFKNFRRFVEFDPIELSGIGILVGGNGSGKSTVVKAMLLTNEYLKSDSLDVFNFQPNNTEDANIVTLKRALNQNGKGKILEFNLSRDGYKFNIKVSGDLDKTIGQVDELVIEDEKWGISYEIMPKQNSVSITWYLHDECEKLKENIDKQTRSRDNLKIKKSKIKNKKSPEYGVLDSKIKKIDSNIKNIEIQLETKLKGFSLKTTYTEYNIKSILKEAFSIFLSESESQIASYKNRKKKNKELDAYISFENKREALKKSIEDIRDATENHTIVYLGACLLKQSTLFAIREKTNALAQAIHDFVQEGIYDNQKSEAHTFVKKWMGPEHFNIGKSLEIKLIGGEAYEVNVENNGLKIPLADFGTGTIQVLLLILRLATVLEWREKMSGYYTVIIEEPELNLHPASQSKLAEVFHEVYSTHKIKVIIETHSEYLVRKTQLLVKNNGYENKGKTNPFSVIYFDQNKHWPLVYNNDGTFYNSFGKGFYDESSNLILNLL